MDSKDLIIYAFAGRVPLGGRTAAQVMLTAQNQLCGFNIDNFLSMLSPLAPIVFQSAFLSGGKCQILETHKEPTNIIYVLLSGPFLHVLLMPYNLVLLS